MRLRRRLLARGSGLALSIVCCAYGVPTAASASSSNFSKSPGTQGPVPAHVEPLIQPSVPLGPSSVSGSDPLLSAPDHPFSPMDAVSDNNSPAMPSVIEPAAPAPTASIDPTTPLPASPAARRISQTDSRVDGPPAQEQSPAVSRVVQDSAPDLGRLKAMAASTDAAQWTGARSGPDLDQPLVLIPRRTWLRSIKDCALYTRISASSLYWYTFPRLIERWKELQRSLSENQGKKHAVADFKGFFVAHRVMGSTGSYSPLGFRVAANGVVTRDAWLIYKHYFEKYKPARKAFNRFLKRAKRFNPNRRSSQFRKIIFHALRHASALSAAELPGFFDSQASEQAARAIADFQREKQSEVLRRFDRVVRELILEMNQGLPRGQRIVGALLMGSFANGSASEGSDLDVQAISEGDRRYNEIFLKKLKESWKNLGMAHPISGFQYTLPLSQKLILRVHREAYLIYSPYPEVIEALRCPPDHGKDASGAAQEKRGLGAWIFQHLYPHLLYAIVDFYEAYQRSSKTRGSGRRF